MKHYSYSPSSVQTLKIEYEHLNDRTFARRMKVLTREIERSQQQVATKSQRDRVEHEQTFSYAWRKKNRGSKSLKINKSTMKNTF